MKRRSIRCMLLLTFFCVLMLQGTVAFAANKAAKISTVFSPTKEGGYPSYALSMDFKKTGKLAKKNTFSGSFLIQKDLLKKENDAFVIYPEVECYDQNGMSAGTMSGACMIAVIKGKKGYNVYTVTETAFHKAGKIASVKKNAKGIMIRIKNLPLTMDGSGLAAKRSYTISPTVWFNVDAAETVKGNIWTDSISVKTEKKQTISFNRKDYRYLHALTEDGVPVSVTVKATGK